MPVNTAALKTFAPAMRRQLLEAVGRKLDLLLNSQTPDTLSTYAKQIAELREQEAESREQLLERVAYTWFNRLCALRYLDAKGWHPFGCRVLMPAAEGETQPELLKLMRAGSLPAELKSHTNETRLHGLLDGQIPPAIAGADPQGEVYRELVLASCRSYHQLLPELFEGLDDASELLLPDDLLSEGSIAGGFRNAISDADCEDVEIIGWLYQFYISEKKDQVIGKVVKSEDIPAATQLFTPNWIVKYMVQNSLGATWLATYPDSPLKGQMEFYIEPAEQTPEVQVQLAAITPESLDPEELTLIDPACGSGHILVEAYGLLKAIYLERGYRQRDIPELILGKNLFGLDICPRAVQMASFSLLMKGREDDRRLLERDINPNITGMLNSEGVDTERLATAFNLSDYGLNRPDLVELCQLFKEATTLGSLIQLTKGLIDKLTAIKKLSEASSHDLLASKSLSRLKPLVRQAELLSAKYHAVIANPPYLSQKGMSACIKQYLKTCFPIGQKDLFASFMLRATSWLKSASSPVALVTPFSWMYLSSFEALRLEIFGRSTLKALVELETNAFEPAMVTVCSFVYSSVNISGYRGGYIRLSEFKGARNQAPKTLEAIRNRHCGWFFEADQAKFKKISGTPVAYWVGPKMLSVFEGARLERTTTTEYGIITGNNDRFLRLWHEVSHSKIGGKWIKFNKGGIFRKWYGNLVHVVDYESSGEFVNFSKKPDLDSAQFFSQHSSTWSDVTSGQISFRALPPGHLSSNTGPTAITDDAWAPHELLAYLNTTYVVMMAKILNPTLHFTLGDFGNLPMPERFFRKVISSDIQRIVLLAQNDWDAYERSWDFATLPLLKAVTGLQATSLEASYSAWIDKNKDAVFEMKQLEEGNNCLFKDAYDMQDNLPVETPIEQITLTTNPAYRYSGSLSEAEKWIRFRADSIEELLSYCVGCMMGRYSLDEPGLVLADSRDSQAEQLAAYEEKVSKPLSEIQFKPDPDGIIPVLDGEWFEDDIVARTREFLTVTFPESSVTENLRFIEESLGKDIRKYFCSEFYKDHLQTYKKRPIYWMVQSPKKGFSCLIYLHRYTKDTLNQVLNNYFRPYLQKLEARLAQLGLDQLNDDLPARERTAARKEADKITKVLKECQAWEQDALLPLAQQRIPLDLDDGVKVNYLKLQDVLAPIPGLAAKED